MPRVELVYASACPNVKATRTALVSAFVEAGVVPRWSEHGVEDPRTPEALRGYGSPAILVDGRHVLGATKENGPSCRLFFDAAGKVATSPSVAAIAAALRAATAVTSAQAPRTWRSSLAVLPGIGVPVRRLMGPALCRDMGPGRRAERLHRECRVACSMSIPVANMLGSTLFRRGMGPVSAGPGAGAGVCAGLHGG